MTIAESRVKKWGNSLGIIIPKHDVEALDLKEGETVVVDIIKKKFIDGFGMCKGAKPFEREKGLLDREL